jgi:hypothetical protein
MNPEERRGRSWVKAILGVMCLLMATMWVYYFVTYFRHGKDPGVYQLADENWRRGATPICIAAQAERSASPLSTPSGLVSISIAFGSPLSDHP